MVETFEHMGFEGSAEVDIARSVCFGKVLFISDVVTYEAPSVAELKTEFQLAVEDYVQTCKEVGKEPARPFSGVFQVRLTPELHRSVAVRAAKERRTVNHVMRRAAECYLNGSSNSFHVQLTSVSQGISAQADSSAKVLSHVLLH